MEENKAYARIQELHMKMKRESSVMVELARRICDLVSESVSRMKAQHTPTANDYVVKGVSINPLSAEDPVASEVRNVLTKDVDIVGRSVSVEKTMEHQKIESSVSDVDSSDKAKVILEVGCSSGLVQA